MGGACCRAQVNDAEPKYLYEHHDRIPSTISEEHQSEMSQSLMQSRYSVSNSNLHTAGNGHNRDSMGSGTNTMVGASTNPLVTIPFFEELDPKAMRKLQDLFQRQNYRVEDIITDQGDDEHRFYIIISGSVKMAILSQDKQKSIPLGTLTQGQWFGDSCLVENTMQPVRVTALEDSVLMSISRENFAQFVKETPSVGASVSEMGTVKPVRVSLRSLPLFKDVDELKLQVLAGLFEFRRFPPSTVVCRQGDMADGFYVLVKGTCTVYVLIDAETTDNGSGNANNIGSGGVCAPTQAPAHTNTQSNTGLGGEGEGSTNANPNTMSRNEVSHTRTATSLNPARGSLRRPLSEAFGNSTATGKDGNGQKKVFLDTLRQGQWFGETALLEDMPRTATVETIGDSLMIFLSKERFSAFLRYAPEAKKALFTVTQKERVANMLKTIPIFNSLIRKQIGPVLRYEARLNDVAALFRYQKIEAGQEVFRQGQPATGFYIITSGAIVMSAEYANRSSIITPSPRLNLNRQLSVQSEINSIRAPGSLGGGDGSPFGSTGGTESFRNSPSPLLASNRQLSVSRDGGGLAVRTIQLATLVRGEFFGETSLLEKCNNACTATAAEESVLLHMPSELYDKLHSVAPEVVRVIRRTSSLRVATLSRFLPHLHESPMSPDGLGNLCGFMEGLDSSGLPDGDNRDSSEGLGKASGRISRRSPSKRASARASTGSKLLADMQAQQTPENAQYQSMLAGMSALFRYHTVEAGTVLQAAGKPVDVFYLVVQGQVAVLEPMHTLAHTPIATLTPAHTDTHTPNGTDAACAAVQSQLISASKPSGTGPLLLPQPNPEHASALPGAADDTSEQEQRRTSNSSSLVQRRHSGTSGVDSVLSPLNTPQTNSRQLQTSAASSSTLAHTQGQSPVAHTHPIGPPNIGDTISFANPAHIVRCYLSAGSFFGGECLSLHSPARPQGTDSTLGKSNSGGEANEGDSGKSAKPIASCTVAALEKTTFLSLTSEKFHTYLSATPTLRKSLALRQSTLVGVTSGKKLEGMLQDQAQ